MQGAAISTRFKTYQQAVAFLIHELPKTQTSVFKDAENFQYNQRMLALLGSPQNNHAALHVAGTSGKGSICYMINAILREHKKQTGLLVSPHVYDILERIQINGEPVSELLFTENLSRLLVQVAPERPSYFETLAMLGFVVTSQVQLDYLVVETGFGGLWDTSNTIERADKVCVLGQIGLDHTAILGDTIEAIAAQKAGIIHRGNIVIALRQTPAVNEIFERAAAEQGCVIQWVEKDDDYTVTNKRLALAAVNVVAERDGWQVEKKLVDKAIKNVFIPGRFENLTYQGHKLLLDGAHNPQKLAALAQRLKLESRTPVTAILALGDRKDLRGCLEALQPAVARIIATEYFTDQQDIPRQPTTASTVQKACEGLGIECQAFTKPAQALAAAANYAEPIVATGSFYLLSEIKQAMEE